MFVGDPGRPKQFAGAGVIQDGRDAAREVRADMDAQSLNAQLHHLALLVHEDEHFRGSAVGLATVVNLGVLLLLLPVMGLPGAAWAMTTGYVVSTLVLAIAFRRASGMGFTETWLPRREDASFLLDVVRSSMRGWRSA